METKSLLIGITSFIAGGLLVSIAATTFEKDESPLNNNSSMSMSQMADQLKDKTGDEFDKAFIEGMISHHEGAIEMARMAESQAQHKEIKSLSKEIISAQATEITQMKQWQKDWGYPDNSGQTHDGGH